MRMTAHAAKARDGYVLVAALVVLAIAGLATASAAQRTGDLVERVRLLTLEARAERAGADALERAAWAFTTSAVAPCGLVPDAPLNADRLAGGGVEGGACAPLDGRWRLSAAEDGLPVQLLDGAALLSVNGPAARQTRRLAERFDQGARAQALHDALLDHTDGDSIAKTFGAEAARYADGRRGARNAPMITPYEIMDVAGWAPLVSPFLFSVTSARAAAGLNPSTAPAIALAYGLGLNAREAEAIVAAREGTLGWGTRAAFEQALDRPLDEVGTLETVFRLEPSVRVRVDRPGGGVEERVIEYRPAPDVPAVRTLYRMRLPDDAGPVSAPVGLLPGPDRAAAQSDEGDAA